MKKNNLPTHKALTSLAVNWLKRPNSRGGHGCHVAVSESAGGWVGEIPDAIGFRNDYDCCYSVVVEVKVSRQDFLADKNKSHRKGDCQAMGNYRYYLCPEGVINIDDLPSKWGLLWVNSRGHIKAVKSPFMSSNYHEQDASLEAMRFESNATRELFLMTRLLSRLGDVEALNEKYRSLHREINQSSQAAETWRQKSRELSRENFKLKRQLESTVN